MKFPVFMQKDPDSDFWGLVTVDIGKLSKEVRRINISMPEHILSKIDSYAYSEGETRSGFLAAAAIEYITRHSSR